MEELTVHGEALAVANSFIAVDKVLEVVIFILDRADLVILVDEVPIRPDQ